ncbi:helix-turn-helix domain-containing protein [Saccharothrix saharensis]|uniref:helix-turn-helix domain-containing protein n=1 Tax=Saccharothrix saharensis TaxID=571190 RepID=UPI0036A1C81E
MDTDDKNTNAARVSSAHSRELGEVLRQARQRARMSSSRAANGLGWSLGKLSKLETGTRGTSVVEIATLLGHYGTEKTTREQIIELAREPDTGGFLRAHHQIPDTLVTLSAHECAAESITAYEPLIVPSLAQTEDYAYALTGNRNLARARMARQQQLHTVEGQRVLLFVHEAALRSVVGTPTVMREQMLRLALMGGWEQIELRLILQSAAVDAAFGRPATLLTFPEPIRPLAYVETDTATVFQDDPHAVAHYEDKMLRLHSLALSADMSREVFASWADAYDRKPE